jgi:ectoine hydroxylase-related dioxygenase (phytanoyl-CoA dioxygenase family)
MNYCAGYIRQQENQQLGIPASIARTFDERLQQLVGYSVYNGLIGHIDKHDPRTVLLTDDAVPAGMVWDAG